MYLLGVDVGTTSLKAAVFNENGEQISSSTVDYTLIAKGNYIEFDADEYWRLFKKGMEDVVGELKISALSIDTQCETLILADENGIPLCNAIVWLDNRAIEEATEIKEAFGVKKTYEVTGQPDITATWPACKLLWIKKNRPEIWSKIRKIFLLEDYLLFKLTGEFVTGKTIQSSSLYFDIRNGTWWNEMLDFIGISQDVLPKLHNSGECIGHYYQTAVITGVMDQIAGAIGAGIVEKGVISEMTGTTMVIFVPIDEIPPYNQNSRIPCHYNADGNYCLVLWTTIAGMALKWFKNNFCENFDFKELDELAKNIPVGSDGLIILPHFCGSTMPKYNPNAKGTIHGITLEHTRGHFVRCILESVSYMLKSNLDYLGGTTNEIRSIGGGANSELWCQIKADVTNTNIVTLKNKETSCLGSAIIAGVGIGIFPSINDACKKIVKTDKNYSPSGLNYTKAYDNYCKLDELLNKEVY